MFHGECVGQVLRRIRNPLVPTPRKRLFHAVPRWSVGETKIFINGGAELFHAISGESFSGMILLVNVTKMLVGDVCINLSSPYMRVTQECLDTSKISTI